jgi:hypothetical protein
VGVYRRYAQLSLEAQKFQKQYKANPAAACKAQDSSSLCSAQPGSYRFWQLALAASGGYFDSRKSFGLGFNPLRTPGDQRPCNTCAAWATTYAAEAAVAVALRQTPVKLSVQDLAFCGPSSPKSCSATLSVADAARSLTTRPLVKEACLPYTPISDPSQLCRYTCRAQDPLAAKGTFRAVQLNGVAQVQMHIRRYGAVVTRCDIHSNFAAFLAANKGGFYTGPIQPGEPPVEGHCVLLIGYNNAERYWLAMNSWGPAFGEQGVFKVRRRGGVGGPRASFCWQLGCIVWGTGGSVSPGTASTAHGRGHGRCSVLLDVLSSSWLCPYSCQQTCWCLHGATTEHTSLPLRCSTLLPLLNAHSCALEPAMTLSRLAPTGWCGHSARAGQPAAAHSAPTLPQLLPAKPQGPAPHTGWVAGTECSRKPLCGVAVTREGQ